LSGPALDLRAISTALFLPLLYWTGGVVMISLFGYPGVVCMTPLAWLLALPVGLRVARESESPRSRAVLEAVIAGGLLGLWQGLLFAAAMTAAPLLPGGGSAEELPSSLLVSGAAGLLGMPVTGLLAGGIAWMARKRG
jgi:hypothetical protein